MQYFDSSVVKIQADGDVVLSSYLEDDETLVPGSFAPKPVPEVPQLRELNLVATRAVFDSTANQFTVNVSDFEVYPIIDEILAGDYRAPALKNSFGETELFVNDGEIIKSFPFVAVFRNSASLGTVDLLFDLSGSAKHLATSEVSFGFSKILRDDTVLRVVTDENTAITRPSNT